MPGPRHAVRAEWRAVRHPATAMLSTPVVFGILWVLASTVTAFLPMRAQMVPGVALLVAAPVLLVWIGVEHGALWAAFGLAAFLSMFRNPLIYFWKRATGRPVSLPPELRGDGE